MSTSSCRPVDLLRFEGSADAVAEGLLRRVGHLADALDGYHARCGPPHRVAATAGTDDVVHAWARGVRELGEWVGDVGRAFFQADATHVFMHGGDPSTAPSPAQVQSLDDRTLAARLGRWPDPHRGVAAGAAGGLAADLGLDADQDAPPAWLRHLGQGGTYGAVTAALTKGVGRTLDDLPDMVHVQVRYAFGLHVDLPGGSWRTYSLTNQLEARLRLPTASAPTLLKAASWTGRASNALAFFTSATQQWHDDAHLDDTERAMRAALRGSFVAGLGVGGGFMAGAGAAAPAGAFCGPVAPFCSAGAGVVGGVAGGFLGDKIADVFPGMTVSDDERAARRHAHLREALAHDAGDAEPSLARRVDLLVSEIVGAESDQSPPRVDHAVDALLANAPMLADSTATAATTTTTTTDRPEPALDPWPTRRPYE